MQVTVHAQDAEDELAVAVVDVICNKVEGSILFSDDDVGSLKTDLSDGSSVTCRLATIYVMTRKMCLIRIQTMNG